MKKRLLFEIIERHNMYFLLLEQEGKMEEMEIVICILLVLNFFLLMIMIRSNRQLLRLTKEQMHQLLQMQERLMRVESGIERKPAEQSVYCAKEEQSAQRLQVQEKEALINEVLSEVFI